MMIYALLTDTTGFVLLLRQRGSALWSLPGGELHPSVSASELLTTYCQRQIGVAPATFGPVRAFSLVGIAHSAAVGTVARARTMARGRVEAVLWTRLDALPTETQPAARVAVATLARELMAEKVSAIRAAGASRMLHRV